MQTRQAEIPEHVPTSQSIGAQLRRALKESGLQPETLASELKLSMPSLYRVLRGDKPLSYQDACRAAIALDKSIDWFMQEPAA